MRSSGVPWTQVNATERLLRNRATIGNVGVDMTKRLFLVSLIMMISPLIGAAELPAEDAKKLEKFERTCVSNKKKKSVCRCMALMTNLQ